MHQSVQDYIQSIPNEYIQDKDVLEVGSRNINGGIKDIILSKQPRNYIGTDKEKGEGVNIVVPVEELTATVGHGTWDVVISTETLEHIQDWRTGLNQMKKVLRPGGLLIITTRSPGFPQHNYPHDYHRYTKIDMEYILRDMVLLNLQDDPMANGVFVTAYKPVMFELCDNSDYNLHKIE